MNTEGWDIVEQAAELARRGEEFALATVVWRQAPSSGQMGSRAIITREGQLYGFIGGACAEPVVLREAMRVIESREPRLLFLGTADVPQARPARGDVLRPDVVPERGRHADLRRTRRTRPRPGRRGRLPDDPHAGRAGRHPRLEEPRHRRRRLLRRRRHRALDRGDRLAGPRRRGRRTARGRPRPRRSSAWSPRTSAASPLLAYLAERGVPQHLLDRVRTPVGLDLGRTSHQEIAVAVLAELVQRRAAGEFSGHASARRPRSAAAVEVLDPVCGMTVTADDAHFPVEHGGTTYYFCCVRLLGVVRGRPGALPERCGGLRMLIKNQFDVAEPLDKVWEFFGERPAGRGLPARRRAHRGPRRRDLRRHRRRPDGPGQAAVRRQGQDPRARRRRQADGHRRGRRRPEGPRPGGDDDHRTADVGRLAAPRSTSTRTSSSPARPRSTAAA